MKRPVPAPWLLLGALAACQSAPPLSQQPAWIEDPGPCAVGSAATHARGRYYQEELATTRARERLAARYGVQISSVSTISETVRNETLSVRSDHDIQQVLNSREVKAHIKVLWHDSVTDTVWVELCPIAP